MPELAAARFLGLSFVEEAATSLRIRSLDGVRVRRILRIAQVCVLVIDFDLILILD